MKSAVTRLGLNAVLLNSHVDRNEPTPAREGMADYTQLTQSLWVHSNQDSLGC